ncbi:hypothetical protein C8R43DRAFT_1129187 [Mycena crocata]|nr:hypothetical protein C8R43DRAFT_1129187 [Mycena crocata]
MRALVHALSPPPRFALDTTTGAPLELDDDDPDVPERPGRPIPPRRAEYLNEARKSPTPHQTPPPFDGEENMNISPPQQPPPPQAQNPAPGNGGQPMQGMVGAAGNAQGQGPPVAVFAITLAAFHALVAHNEHLNPHLGFRAAEAAPANNRDGFPAYQRSTGANFPNFVFTRSRTMRNLSLTQVHLLDNDPEMVVFVIALGGQLWFNLIRNSVEELGLALSGIMDGAPDIRIYNPVPVVVQTTENEKYMHPGVMFARIPSAANRAKIPGRTFAVHKEVAFHCTDVNRQQRRWPVGTFHMSSDADPEEQRRDIATGVFDLMNTDYEISHHIDVVTQNEEGSLAERTFNVARSLDGHFIPHDTDPCMVVYMEPFGTEEEDDHLRILIRKHTIKYGMVAFYPMCDAEGNVQECPICVQETHPSFSCPLGPHWWGPPNIMSKIVDGRLAWRGAPVGGRGLHRGSVFRGPSMGRGNGGHAGDRNHGGHTVGGRGGGHGNGRGGGRGGRGGGRGGRWNGGGGGGF